MSKALFYKRERIRQTMKKSNVCWKIIVDPFLTDSQDWFISDENTEFHIAVHQEMKKIHAYRVMYQRECNRKTLGLHDLVVSAYGHFTDIYEN